MGVFQWIVIIMWTLNIIITSVLHGREKPQGTYNITEALLNNCISFLILYFGGFFN